MINTVQEIVDKLRTVYPSAQYDIYRVYRAGILCAVLLHSAASCGRHAVPVRSA